MTNPLEMVLKVMNNIFLRSVYQQRKKLKKKKKGRRGDFGDSQTRAER